MRGCLGTLLVGSTKSAGLERLLPELVMGRLLSIGLRGVIGSTSFGDCWSSLERVGVGKGDVPTRLSMLVLIGSRLLFRRFPVLHGGVSEGTRATEAIRAVGAVDGPPGF